jgi:hypothetical protein
VVTILASNPAGRYDAAVASASRRTRFVWATMNPSVGVCLDLVPDRAAHDRVLPDVIGDGDRVEAGFFRRLDDPDERLAKLGWAALPIHGWHMEAKLHDDLLRASKRSTRLLELSNHWTARTIVGG